ncbi:MAG TPA: ADP-ribosylglycohydrolase family protein [Actinocrinis sp.]|nr:ADP-ribosylglycohydrolase family protein [Actinocrinis sp.]
MRKASGTMYGLAYGDALGKPTEFLTYEEIIRRYGPTGPLRLSGDPALVTDDTQMTLAVADALFDTLDAGELTAAHFENPLRDRFLAWAQSPENNRAPGMTCLRAIGRLAEGLPWAEATVADSKGCGANMRVAPIGLLPGLSEADRAGAAQFQAAVTHGHPTALAASDLTAFAVHWLAGGMPTGELLDALRDRCAGQREVYHQEWLGELWQRSTATSARDFIARGWDECLAALDTVERALAVADRAAYADPCLAAGRGWIAEEALATALYCYLMWPDEPVAMLGRAAASSGDSDSIASIAGALAGAALGFAAWPAGWAEQIEYRAELDRIGRAWD